MRFNTPIYFQNITQGKYDSSTGNYGEDVITEDKVYASATSAGVETLNLVYGELRQGTFVVRLQNHYTKTFSRIRIGSKVYKVDYEKSLQKKQVYVVSEVQ